MQSGETRWFLGVLYILTLFFLGAIYFQGEVISGTETKIVDQNLTHSAAGGASLDLTNSFTISSETTVFLAILLTAFFVVAWILTHSKSFS